MQYDNFIEREMFFIMGAPKTGKTRLIGTFPKPLLHIAIGNDGGARVLRGVEGVKPKKIENDPMIGGKIKEASFEKLAKVIAELRQPNADKFKVVVIDTIGGLQDDTVAYFEAAKGGRRLSEQEWGQVSTIMMNTKDNLKRLADEQGIIVVFLSHTKEMELPERIDGTKEIRIIPDLTKNTGKKYLKDADHIIYLCRKTIIKLDGSKGVKFLAYIGPHPLIDTGTRDIVLGEGSFVENFSYQEWQRFVKEGKLTPATLLEIKEDEKIDDNKGEDND